MACYLSTWVLNPSSVLRNSLKGVILDCRYFWQTASSIWFQGWTPQNCCLLIEENSFSRHCRCTHTHFLEMTDKYDRIFTKSLDQSLSLSLSCPPPIDIMCIYIYMYIYVYTYVWCKWGTSVQMFSVLLNSIPLSSHHFHKCYLL